MAVFGGLTIPGTPPLPTPSETFADGIFTAFAGTGGAALAGGDTLPMAAPTSASSSSTGVRVGCGLLSFN